MTINECAGYLIKIGFKQMPRESMVFYREIFHDRNETEFAKISGSGDYATFDAYTEKKWSYQ